MKNTVTIEAAHGAYTRGGTYADTHMEIPDGLLRIKWDGSPSFDSSTTRNILLTFDLSALDKKDVGWATLNIPFYSRVTQERIFDIYRVCADAWDQEAVTWNTMPCGEKIFEDAPLTGISRPDFTKEIFTALERGEKMLSIRMVAKFVSEGEQTVYFGIKKPYLFIAAEKPERNYITGLCETAEENDALWTYAGRMFDEWYERYQDLPPAGEADEIQSDPAAYIKTNYASGSSLNYDHSKKEYRSRPLSALTDIDEYVGEDMRRPHYDKYGGLVREDMKRESTGFFRREKIDGRWWLIDPLGYPFCSVGLSDIQYSQLGSPFQRQAVLDRYGSFEKWAEETTKHMRDDLGFNSAARPSPEIIDVEDGLAIIVPLPGFMSGYGHQNGLLGKGNGSTIFAANNAMPVFDPAFVDFADERARTKVKHQGLARLIGYTSDNELPMDVYMLDNWLTVNPYDPKNRYVYSTAWHWLCRMTGKDNPGAEDITDELRDLFRGFVWDRYFYVVSAAIKRYDPDHMYMGARFLTVVKDSRWVMRFAAQYVDVMTINWYFSWEPQADSLCNIAKNGDLPFIVTEFYAKAEESVWNLANTSGAGFFVKTQRDRADFYQTFVLRLLECKNAVGWEWFQYMDNDPNSGTGDGSSINSNKGILASDLTEYTTLTDAMKELHQEVYRLIRYYDTKYKAKHK